MNILSLFANIGVAEARFNELENVRVAVANELVPRRAELYQRLYPDSCMICGDILDEKIFDRIYQESVDRGVDVVMATPPCQGISTAGQQIEGDERNNLTIPAIRMIKMLHPRYVLIENVPGYVNTYIKYNDEDKLITDIIREYLDAEYYISINILDTKDYGVPQTRERAIILLSRKDQIIWELPEKCKEVTMRDVIGDIPEIDPFVRDLQPDEFHKLFPLYEERRKRALKISKWNIPPVHIYRQVRSMQYTPTGKSAFDNEVDFKPVKKNGELVKGYRNTYKRQNWDTPAYTVTMDNRKISSQNNVHPGRFVGVDLQGRCMYSDARALTLYELMRVMSLPSNWPIPSGTQEAFLRRIIGEGIPPLFTCKLFNMIK